MEQKMCVTINPNFSTALRLFSIQVWIEVQTLEQSSYIYIYIYINIYMDCFTIFIIYLLRYLTSPPFDLSQLQIKADLSYLNPSILYTTSVLQFSAQSPSYVVISWDIFTLVYSRQSSLHNHLSTFYIYSTSQFNLE